MSHFLLFLSPKCFLLLSKFSPTETPLSASAGLTCHLLNANILGQLRCYCLSGKNLSIRLFFSLTLNKIHLRTVKDQTSKDLERPLY